MDEDVANWVRAQLPDHQIGGFAPLKAEASYRTFYRVSCTPTDAFDPAAPRSQVLMVSPPEKENNTQFVRLAGIFGKAGLPVPEILAQDSEHGWYLMSDLGDRDLEAAYPSGDADAAVQIAIDTLVSLQSVQDPAIPPYTAERFSDELEIFAEWLIGQALHQTIPISVRLVFEILVDRTRTQVQCCVHRDYHCRNLMFNRNHDGQIRFGIVDFQDALVGPASYDLASLLHDCYHEFEPAEVERWTGYFLAKTSLLGDAATFKEDLAYSAVQRQLKAAGIFARLKLRDGRSTHLSHIEPVVRRVQRLAAGYRQLAPLADWLREVDLSSAVRHLRDWQ